MITPENVFRTTGNLNSETYKTEFSVTNSLKKVVAKKNFFDSNPNDTNAHYFFGATNEDVGPTGVHIFSEYDAKVQKKGMDFHIKKRSIDDHKKSNSFSVSLKNRGISENSVQKPFVKNLQNLTVPKMPRYISPHLEKINMNWRQGTRPVSSMGKGHMQVRKLNKNYFGQLFNLGAEEKK